ncbi:MAG: PilZ domain-containing protein [Gammaproteobacteria bacterium]|nr:PilZ domain-containing protein [Gammaproteobacteria bacterium]
MLGRKKKNEQRIQPRWKIDQFLAIYDEDQATFLGRVEDLSESGMCVLSTVTIPVGNHVKLAVEVIQDDGSVKTFFLRCRSLWTRAETDSEYYRIGFQFSGIAQVDASKVRRLIEHQRALTERHSPPSRS